MKQLTFLSNESTKNMTIMKENSAENACIDLMKWIASLMIFAMHCQAFTDLGHFSFLWELLTRWGVPYFFITSSYFLFSRCVNSDPAKTVKHYIFRIALLYSVWFIFNIPSIFFSRLYTQDMSSINTWLMLIKNSILSSTFTGSWYLVSCMFCALLISFLCKFFSSRTIICISAVIQVLCIFSSAYVGVLPNIIQKWLDFLCFPGNFFGGMLYFSIGKWIAENKDTIQKKNRKIYWSILLCSYLFYFFEIYITKKTGLYHTSDQAFSLIPVGFCLFVITLQSTIKLKNARLLRKISTIIYCAQGNILIFSSVLHSLFHVESSLLRFICSCIAMTMIITLILILQKQNKYKWIRYFT